MEAFGIGAGEAQRALTVLCQRGQAEKVARGQYEARREAAAS
jgi:hypothetical protein